MSDFPHFDKQVRNEALINEFKGNVFEYLVGSELSKHFKIESSFVGELPDSYRQQLSSYERWLREHDPELFAKLPSLARATTKSILDSIHTVPTRIQMIGKIAASQVDELGEADMIIHGTDRKLLSLKLSKSGAFVNTKSGGIKSFLSTYFSFSESSTQFQSELNNLLSIYFHEFAHSLHYKADLNYDSGFDESWNESGLPELPGELPAEMREDLVKFYSQTIKKLYEFTLSIYHQSPEKFAEALLPIFGFSENNILQVTCFYNHGNNGRYQLSEVTSFTKDIFCHECPITFLTPEEGKSSFEIVWNNLRLQIRVKPMNKFTSEALKVNCSVKKVSDK